MKIGGEYLFDKISSKNFEKLAEETGLAKPLVRRRVPELANTLLQALPRIDTSQPDAEKVPKDGARRDLITRCTGLCQGP